MTWSRFDDAAPLHPKAKRAGNEAWSLWAAAIMFCNRFLTDGFVSLESLASDCLPRPISAAKAKRLAEELCECRVRPEGVGLFERADGGYIVHDFSDHNPSKEEVESKREADRVRKKVARGQSDGSPARTSNSRPSGHETTSERTPNGVPALARVPAPAGARPPSPPVPSQPSHTRPGPASAAPPSLQARAKLWLEDPNRAAFVHPQPERWPEVLELQQALADTFGHPVERPRTSQDPRCLLPLRRYADGFTQAQLLAAIVGAKHSRAIAESREYQTLATILRDAAQVDKLAALAGADDDEGPPPEVRRRLAASRQERDPGALERALREAYGDDWEKNMSDEQRLSELRKGVG